MNFTVITKELVAALQRVQSVTGNSIVTVSAKGKFLRVASAGKANTLAIKVPAKIEKEGVFSIEGNMLAQSIKTRAEVSIALAESQVIIKGKSLSHKLVTVPTEEVPVFSKKEGSAISTEIHKAFADAVASAAISNVHDQNAIAYRVTLNKKGLLVVAADAHHMAAVHNTNIKSKEELKFTLSSVTFGTISSLANKDQFELQFTDAEVFAWNSTFELRVPTLAEDGGPDDQQISSMLEAITSNKPKTKATVSAKELFGVTEAFSGIFESGANVKLSSTEKGLELRFNTSYGESRGLLKTTDAKGKFSHQVDLPLIEDTFKLVKDDALELCVLGDHGLYLIENIEGVKAVYLVTLVTG